MLVSLGSLAALGCALLASLGIGHLLRRAVGLPREDIGPETIWCVGLGMAAAGCGLAVWGLLGGLHARAIVAATVAAAAWGLRVVWRWRTEETAAPAAVVNWRHPEPPAWLRRGAAGLACVAAIASGISALAPPVAGDALCYHLELPKRFLADGAITYLPDTDNSTFPLLAEMLFLWGLALEGGVTAQLMHWTLGLVLAGGTLLVAREFLGRGWAAVAAAAVLLVPGVNIQMTAPLNDLALAAWTALGLAAWVRARRRNTPGDDLAAGIFFGAALGTKYLALPWLLAVAVGWLLDRWLARQPATSLWRGGLIAAATALLVGGGWYVRSALHTGNPVYPYLQNVFASTDAPEGLRESKRPLGRAPHHLFSAAWLATMQPERFGGRSHQPGILFLAMLPGLVLCRELRRLRPLLVAAAAFWIAWFVLRQNVRFLLPVLPLLAVLAIAVAAQAAAFAAAPRRALWAVLMCILLGNAAIAAVRGAGHAPVALGLETRHEYLRRMEPSYAIGQSLRQSQPAARLLSQEQRAFYFPGHTTRESIFRRRTAYDRLAAKPEQLRAYLQQAGFTHLLLVESRPGDPIRYDPTLSHLADTVLADSLRLVAEHTFHNADGCRRYRLLAWKESAVAAVPP